MGIQIFGGFLIADLQALTWKFRVAVTMQLIHSPPRDCLVAARLTGEPRRLSAFRVHRSVRQGSGSHLGRSYEAIRPCGLATCVFMTDVHVPSILEDYLRPRGTRSSTIKEQSDDGTTSNASYSINERLDSAAPHRHGGRVTSIPREGSIVQSFIMPHRHLLFLSH